MEWGNIYPSIAIAYVISQMKGQRARTDRRNVKVNMRCVWMQLNFHFSKTTKLSCELFPMLACRDCRDLTAVNRLEN